MYKGESEGILPEGNSVLVAGPWAAEIHKANLQILENMSPEEIMKEQMKLNSTLDPTLIKFIKTKRKKKVEDIMAMDGAQAEANNDTCKLDKKDHIEALSIGESSKTLAGIPEKISNEEEMKNLPKPPAEIIQQAEEKGWVHMDTVEAEKLEWMEEIPSATGESDPEKPYNARFDFNGELSIGAKLSSMKESPQYDFSTLEHDF